MLGTAGEIVYGAAARGIVLPPAETVAEFVASTVRHVSGPLRGQRFIPRAYQREWLDPPPGVETVILRTSSQVGKTACKLGIIGYYLLREPADILYVSNNLNEAEKFARTKLKRLLEVPEIASLLVTTRGTTGPALQKQTTTGAELDLAGAQTPAALAASSKRVLLCDELERWKEEVGQAGRTEGDPLRVVIRRTTEYGRRRRILIASTPSIEGGPIDVEYQRGDCRRFLTPCPSCGEFFERNWRCVRFSADRDPAKAALVCPSCEHAHTTDERIRMVEAGKWEPTRKPTDPRVRSYRLNQLYVGRPEVLTDIVQEFTEAYRQLKAGDRRAMDAWRNLTMGEPRPVTPVEATPASVLMARRETWADLPEIVWRVATVDTQGDRLELLSTAWTADEQCYVERHAVFVGDPSRSPGPDTVWADLDDDLLRHSHHVTLIDEGGDATQQVRAFTGPRTARKVYALKGANTPAAPIVSAPVMRSATGPRKVPIVMVGTHQARVVVSDRLKLTETGPGFVHLPEWMTEEHAEQLTSEVLVTERDRKTGQLRQRWHKRRARNEWWDLLCYALAGFKLLGKPKPKHRPAPTRKRYVPERRWFGR